VLLVDVREGAAFLKSPPSSIDLRKITIVETETLKKGPFKLPCQISVQRLDNKTDKILPIS